VVKQVGEGEEVDECQGGVYYSPWFCLEQKVI